MTIPKREQVLQLAKELYFNDMAKSGINNFNDPEPNELSESGYCALATSMLMRSEDSEYKTHIEEEARELGLIKEKNESTENFENSSDLKFDVKEAMDNGFFVCGTSQCGKSTLVKHLAKKLIEANVNVKVLDVSRVWLHDSPISQVTEVSTSQNLYYWFNGSEILDLSMLDARARVLFVNQYCKQIYVKHVKGFREPEFLIFEDAQTYLPNGSMKISVRKTPIYDGVLDIVTVGANYNLRFGLITQFPALVDKSPVKITMQRYFGLTWEKNDIAYIKFFIGKEASEQLRSLNKGEFVYQYKDRIEKIQTEIFRPIQKVQKVANEMWYKNYKFEVCIA
jgi:energy-coupling factor transporter ATP-binding protein EcfA2